MNRLLQIQTICAFCVVTFFNAVSLQAQSYRNEASQRYSSREQTRKKAKEKVFNPNVVKLNLTGLFVKSIGVQGEHRIGKKSSLALGVIYRPKGSWFVSKFYDTTTASLSISQEARYMISESKYRSLMITPEYRYFLGRHAPRGLYLAAFARFKFDKTEFPYHYYEDGNVVQKIGTANLKETMFGGGILFGYQIMPTKNLAIDFWFIGPWVSNLNVKLNSSVDATKISSLQQSFISQDMKFWFSKENEVKWNSKGISTVFNEFALSARFIGINIGYSF